jgi:cell division protein YceG involved in septum cleavage
LSPGNRSHSERTAVEREEARAERERRRRTAQPTSPAPVPSVASDALSESLPPAPQAAEPKSAPQAVETEPMPQVAEPGSGSEPELQIDHPIAAKLPPPAPAPVRIPPPPPPMVQTGRRRRWPARLRIGVLLLLALAVLGGALAVVLSRSSAPKKAVAPLAVVRVTIPEGETAAQIAGIAAAKGLTGDYLAAARHSRLLDPTHYGAPSASRGLEGFLFPATYELYAGAPVRTLVSEQLEAFQEHFGAQQIHRAHELHITPYQLLIVASIVEREALLERDRPRVAAVIYNRLRLGMTLGVDATIRYALKDYTKPLTEAQLKTDSPYNTRIHHGLPPTPISNPGAAAIAAAANPAHVPYLYYVDGADGCGELVFSTSNEQFEADAAAYREAIAHNGGRVPACHKR